MARLAYRSFRIEPLGGKLVALMTECDGAVKVFDEVSLTAHVENLEKRGGDA